MYSERFKISIGRQLIFSLRNIVVLLPGGSMLLISGNIGV